MFNKLSLYLWLTGTLLFTAAVLHPCIAQEQTPAVKPIEVKVLVLNYDPVVPGNWGQRLHEVCKWQDPRELSRQYVADVGEVSRGLIRYREVLWCDLDEFPVKNDGFQYSLEQFLQLWKARQGWHDPDGADYRQILKDQGVPALIDAGVIDEVWLFGGPYFGYHESAMAGPGAFYINGGQIRRERCLKPR